MGAFEAAIREDFEASRGHPQFEVWLGYALSANDRGEGLLRSIEHSLPNIRGKRHLDIGCAYGGACVAAARRGAESVGVDLDPRLLGFAEANRRDHPTLPLRFLRGDVLDTAWLPSLGTFDFITCDNVIEHVRAPEVLVAHVSRLLNPGGLALITIPNAFSTGQIRKDCHYGQFGVSLLDPLDGAVFMREVLGREHYDVSDYLRFENYVAAFTRHGLAPTLLNPPDARLFEVAVQDARRLAQEVVTANVPPVLRTKVERRLDTHLARLEADVRRASTLIGKPGEQLRAALVRDYHSELWTVMAVREEDAASLGPKG